MDNLVAETNSRLNEIIENLTTIKNEYEEKLKSNAEEIDTQLEKVQKYKTEFFESKAKIEKMNADIEGFETDYKKLVERFKDDELANILIAANKEISLKIDERKRKIVKDKSAMNELVDKAENVKARLVKLTSEKKALELCLNKILDSYNYYSKALGDIIEYSTKNSDNLSGTVYEDNDNEDVKENLITVDLDDEVKEHADEEVTESDDETEKEEVKEEIEEDIKENVFDEDIEEEHQDEDVVENFKEEINKAIDEDDDSEEIDEDVTDLSPLKVEEISDYDNEDVIEGNEHKIVIEENHDFDKFVSDNKKEKEKKEKEKESEDDINIDVNFDDSLVDDDSLYE
jgi:hypothetical protein